MSPQDWVRVNALLSERDAQFLRDLIHQEGYPARTERHERSTWVVLVRRQHAGIANEIYRDNFDGNSRRPSMRRRITSIFRRRRPAA